MKKLLSVVLISVVAAVTASAGIVFQEAEDDYPVEKSLSIQPLFGIKNGKIGEYVFVRSPEKASDTGSTPDDKLSYLEWQISPEYVLGLNLEGCYKNFYMNGAAKFGIPAKCGIVQDSDWRNIQYTATEEQQSWKTNYSESDNYIDYDINLSAKAGYTFTPWWRLKIVPTVGIDYSKIKFTAKDGEYWYGKDIATNSGTDEAEHPGPYHRYNDDSSYLECDTMSGTVLTYTREEYNIWIGTDVIFKSPYNLLIKTGLNAAIYTHSLNFDDHPLRGMTFADECIGFFHAFKADVDLSYQFNQHFSINLNSTVYYLMTIRGKSYFKYDYQDSYAEQTPAQGGADSFTYEISLGCRYTFF